MVNGDINLENYYAGSEYDFTFAIKKIMETKHYPKSSTGQSTRSQGYPLIHIERDPSVYGLRHIDEVVPICIELIGSNSESNHLVNKFQNIKFANNCSKGP